MNDSLKIKLPVGDPNVISDPKVEQLEIDGVKHTITSDGTILDKDGKILKTKEEVIELRKPKQTPEEIEKARLAAETAAKTVKPTDVVVDPFVEGSEVELDGVTYSIDKDGNAIDKDKKIIKTKDELKILLTALTPPDTEINYVSEIQKATNLVIVKDGKPIDYENTTEGLSGYVKDIHAQGVELGSKKAEEKLYAKFPILKQIVSHLVLNGGNLDNFTNTTDYTKIKIGEDENQWNDIYLTAQMERGIPKDEALKMAKYLKDDKQLKDSAEKALLFLSTTQQQRDAKAAKVLADQDELDKQDQISYWNEVGQIVQSKTIKLEDNEFKLPEVVRVKDKDGRITTKNIDDFVNYLSSPINVIIDNQQFTTTQSEYDEYLEKAKRTTNNDVFDAFRRFTKYDDSQILSTNIKHETTKNIIKLTSKPTTSSASTSSTKLKLKLPIK